MFKILSVTLFLFLYSIGYTTNANAEKNSINKEFIQATESGDIAKIKSAIKSGADINTLSTNDDNNMQDTTALMIASRNGDINIVKLLIDSGVDVNTLSENGDMHDTTALMYASWKGYINIVKLLIDSGADVNLKTRYGGYTALNEATKAGHTEIVNLLIKAGAQDTFLIDATIKGDIEEVRNLIKNGEDVNVRAYNNQTALMNATTTAMAKLLLDAGADINIKDNNGVTALLHATYNGNIEVVKLLISSGADINIVTGHLDTIFDYAAEHPEIIKLLEKAGAKK